MFTSGTASKSETKTVPDNNEAYRYGLRSMLRIFRWLPNFFTLFVWSMRAPSSQARSSSEQHSPGYGTLESARKDFSVSIEGISVPRSEKPLAARNLAARLDSPSQVFFFN